MPAAADDALEIALDRDAEVPLGVQLAWALRARILAGALAPGDRLPALHRLAAETGVNANTVRAVHQRLEHDGLVSTRHGSGTFVTGDATGIDAARWRASPRRRARCARARRRPRELAAALMPAAAMRRSRGRRGRRAQTPARTDRGAEHALSELTTRKAAHKPATAERPPTPRPRLLSAASWRSSATSCCCDSPKRTPPAEDRRHATFVILSRGWSTRRYFSRGSTKEEL